MSSGFRIVNFFKYFPVTYFIWPQLRQIKSLIKVRRETINTNCFLVWLKNKKEQYKSKHFAKTDSTEHFRINFHKLPNLHILYIDIYQISIVSLPGQRDR